MFDPKKAPLFYEPHCLTGVSGTQACAAANRRTRNPINGEIVAYAYQGTTVPGSGSISNGMFRGGLPGKKEGWYYDMPYFSYGTRVGFAWDLTGDGKTAIRAAGGIFYNFWNQGQYAFDGGPLITQDKIIRAASIDDIAAFASAGIQFAETPQQTGLPDGFPWRRTVNRRRPASSTPKPTIRGTSPFSAISGSAPPPKLHGLGTSGATSGASRTRTTSRPAPTVIRRTCSTANRSPSTQRRKHRPVLSGVFRAGTTIADLNNINSRCELTGEPIFQVNRDPSLAEEDQMHFNPAAFRRPLPNGQVGKFGNAPVGVLRSGVLKLGLHVVPAVQNLLARERPTAGSGVQPVQAGGVHVVECGLPIRGKRGEYFSRHWQIHDHDQSKERGLTLRFDF